MAEPRASSRVVRELRMQCPSDAAELADGPGSAWRRSVTLERDAAAIRRRETRLRANLEEALGCLPRP